MRTQVERLDGAAVRAWSLGATTALEAARGPIDSLNVFPVADSDTGTNLYLTVAQGADEVTALGAGASAAQAMAAFARGALVGARGNSGVIASQFLLGLAAGFEDGEPDAVALAHALDVAQAMARTAVACPVEGTILTAASAAARAAGGTALEGGDLAATALAALRGAREALGRTPDELAVLRAAGVVDAGATGLVVMLEALVVVVTGRPAPGAVPIAARDLARTGTSEVAGPVAHGEFEVMFLVESATRDLGPELSRRLQALGESVAVVGGPDVWQAHVHTDDPAAAVAAGALGTQRQITVRLLGPHTSHGSSDVAGQPDSGQLDSGQPDSAQPDAGRLGLVVGTCAPGLIRTLARSGAVVMVLTGAPASPASVLRAVVDTGAAHVVVLPGSPAALAAALTAAAPVGSGPSGRSSSAGRQPVRLHVVEAVDDVRVVAGLAAAMTGRSVVHETAVHETAVHENGVPGAVAARLGAIRRAVDDVRSAELAVADDAAARGVADGLLAAGGEVLTLLRGAQAGDAVMDALLDHLAGAYPGLEVVVLEAGQAQPVVAMAVE
ncbi:DAK2 domain-containing protein [Pengzhenrongella frigida]|nr:DAK2 domain-containing protein [Cellulomonas sp. HLT2-17]